MIVRNIARPAVAYGVGPKHALRHDEPYGGRERVQGGLQLVAGAPSKKEGE
jgi:hypothetical protein